jgi:hypothetical protein
MWKKQVIVGAKVAAPAVIVVPAGDATALINAIITANATPGPDTISLAGGIYTFSAPHNWEFGPNALPIIQSDITIEGNGATIERAIGPTTKFRLFYVAGNSIGSLAAGTLTLRDLTLKGGLAKGGDSKFGGGGMGAGGAIFNHGNVVLERVTLNNNTAQGGSGGVGTNYGGAGIGGDAVGNNGGGFGGPPTGTGGIGGAGTTTSGSFVRGGGGGGFLAGADGGNGGTSPGATVGKGGGLGLLGGKGGGGQAGDPGDGGGAFGSDQVSNNGFPVGAGGSYGFGGVSGNAGGGGGVGAGGGAIAGGGFGGGGGGGSSLGSNGGFGGGGGQTNGLGGFSGGNAMNDGGGGGGLGGAIFNHQGTLTLINATLTANLAQGGTGGNNGSGLGGSVFNLNGTVTITSSTLAANTVSTDGGAVYNLAYGNNISTGGGSIALVTISNSILSNSSGTSKDLINNKVDGASGNTATVTFSGANLVVTNASINGATLVGIPTVTVDPQLAPLANNGGLTPTMALADTSAAFNTGSNAANLLTTDQRGFVRISAGVVDLGAFELQVLNNPPTITGATIARTQGATGPISTIATVGDGVGEDAPGSLTVTVLSAPSGITVTGLTNTDGTITANVAVACNATPGANLVQLQVQDSGLLTATANLTVNVAAITLPAIQAGGVAGSPYSQSAAASPAGAYTYSVTGGFLPPALSLDSGTGLISGTLTTAGTFNFEITALGGGCSVSRNYQIVVSCPVITLSVLPGGQVNTNYSQTITATPAGTTYSFIVSNGALPPGLSVSPTGALTGSPTQSGTFNFQVTASGFGSCTGSRDYELVIGCPVITLNPSSLPGGPMGSPYSQSVSATPAGTYSYGVYERYLARGIDAQPDYGCVDRDADHRRHVQLRNYGELGRVFWLAQLHDCGCVSDLNHNYFFACRDRREQL